MAKQFCRVCSTATCGQENVARAAQLRVIVYQIVLNGPPFPIVMLSQDAVVHDSGDHQSGDMVHFVAAVWSFRAVVVHLGQSEPSLRSEPFALGLFVFLCLAMRTILLPTAMRLGIQVELLGLAFTGRMTALVPLASRTGRSFEDLAAVSGLVSGLQRLFAGTKWLGRFFNPGHAVGSILG
jgi:hypothetical protein